MGEELQQALNILQQALNDELIPNHEWDKPENRLLKLGETDNLIIDTHGEGIDIDPKRQRHLGEYEGVSFDLPANVKIIYYQHLDSNCAVAGIADCGLPSFYSGKNLKELCTDSLFDVFLDDRYLNTTFYTENTLETTYKPLLDLILEYIKIVDNLGYSSEDLKGLWTHARMGLKIKKDARITKIIDRGENIPNLFFSADGKAGFDNIYSCPLTNGAQRINFENISRTRTTWHQNRTLFLTQLLGHVDYTLHELCEFCSRGPGVQWYIHIFTCTVQIPSTLRLAWGNKGTDFGDPSSQKCANTDREKQFFLTTGGDEHIINAMSPDQFTAWRGVHDKHGAPLSGLPGDDYHLSADANDGEGKPIKITANAKAWAYLKNKQVRRRMTEKSKIKWRDDRGMETRRVSDKFLDAAERRSRREKIANERRKLTRVQRFADRHILYPERGEAGAIKYQGGRSTLSHIINPQIRRKGTKRKKRKKKTKCKKKTMKSM